MLKKKKKRTYFSKHTIHRKFFRTFERIQRFAEGQLASSQHCICLATFPSRSVSMEMSFSGVSWFFPTDLVGMCYILVLRYITLLVLSFCVSHSGRCHREVPHCGFNLHVPVENLCWAPFPMLVGPLNIFFCEMSVPVFCPIFKTACHLLIDS